MLMLYPVNAIANLPILPLFFSCLLYSPLFPSVPLLRPPPLPYSRTMQDLTLFSLYNLIHLIAAHHAPL